MGRLNLKSKHRLLCGDSTNSEDVARLLGGERVSCVVTDPPYGTGAWKRPASGMGSDCTAQLEKEEWDVWDDGWLDRAWTIGGQRLAFFCAQSNLPAVLRWVGNRPWRLFFWRKSDPRPRFNGQASYAFELLMVIGGCENIGGIDVCEASAPRLNRDADGTGHPHQKPVQVVGWACELAGRLGANVADLYSGSGTTIIAAEQLGRRCFGMELSPAYCDVIVARYEAFTQTKAIQWAG